MDEGGKLGIEIKKNQNCEILITDSGCGMTQEQLDSLFTPFQTSKEDGVGLGLVIAQEIVKEHGGVIDVESKKGETTIFTIKLPWKI